MSYSRGRLSFFRRMASKSKRRLSTNHLVGYKNDYVVKAIVAKTELFKNRLAETTDISLADLRIISLKGLANIDHGSTVLDFGGGAGVHYFTFKKIFPSIKIKWIVVETTELAFKSKSLENNELLFTSSVKEAVKLSNHYDLIIANSSLQYCLDPIEQLNELINIRATYLYLARTIMNKEMIYRKTQESLLSKNGPGQLPLGFSDAIVEYEVIDELETNYRKAMSPYKIIFEINDGEVYNQKSKTAFKQRTFFCKLD
jgi:putative methyltransferase (TIGR04325 family)